MTQGEALKAALAATDQALATVSEARDDLNKADALPSPRLQASFEKIAERLDVIRAGIVVLEACERAHPSHGSVQ